LSHAFIIGLIYLYLCHKMSKKIVTYSIIGSLLIFTGIKAASNQINQFKENHSSRIEKVYSCNHIIFIDDKIIFKSIFNKQNKETFILINKFNCNYTNFLLEQISQRSNLLRRFTYKKNSNRTLTGFISNLKI